jgi:RNA polymerase sigma factor (sigma-70 family)
MRVPVADPRKSGIVIASVETQRYRSTEEPATADSFLVHRALAGDQNAFEELVSRYKHSIFVLIYHYVGEYREAEDVLQQVWLQLYLSLGTLRQNGHIKPWLITVARNRSLDVLRHKRLPSFSEVEAGNQGGDVVSFDEIPDMSPTPEELAEHRELQQAIQHAIQTLPHAYSSIVFLRYGEQLTFSEIGRILHMPKSTVKTRYNRAKPLLRDVFTAQFT